ENFVLADHAIAVADQIFQKIENQWLQRNEGGPTPQLASFSIERTILEKIGQIRCSAGLPNRGNSIACRGLQKQAKSSRSQAGIDVVSKHAIRRLVTLISERRLAAMSDATVRFAMNGSEAVVRSGKVRVALFPPQYEREAVTGELWGFAVDLSQALGANLGVDVQFVECPGPRMVIDHLQAGRVDLAFLGVRQTDRADFTRPFIQLDFTCLVP